MRPLKVAVISQYAILVVGFILWFYIRTSAFMRGPVPNEYYTHSWGFQMLVGSLYLAGALVLLTFIVCVEVGLIDLYRAVKARARRHVDGSN